jgi:hypothetical protein
MYGVNLNVVCNTAEVLQKLKDNRDKHSLIVKEAREGYVAKAKAALKTRMNLLEKGEITSLSFDLQPPLNHTSAYNTVIKMLEMHTEATITLGANEVSQFIEDKWEWSKQFLGSNARYSNTAQIMSSSMSDDE